MLAVVCTAWPARGDDLHAGTTEPPLINPEHVSPGPHLRSHLQVARV